MPLVDLDHISRSFGHVRALVDVTLRLEPGTIGLVGNNGAGKSTLLKILLGLLKPDGGRGTVLDCDLGRAANDLRGRIGYMPETAAMVAMLKGVEFVTLAGDLYGMPHRDASRRAHEVLNYVGLGELRYRKLDEYSLGNQQRLKLAAALVHDPQLLLLDEPTNGLDPAGRVEMLKLIEDLIRESGKSVILCTHLLGDVERLCQQVVVLHRGRVVRAGSMESLRGAVRDRYAVGVVGDMSRFQARLSQVGVELSVNGDGRAVASAPHGWQTREFFVAAAESGVVIQHLKLDEENLEQLFIRLTTGEEAALVGKAAAQETIP